jgi:hypothetical protein
MMAARAYPLAIKSSSGEPGLIPDVHLVTRDLTKPKRSGRLAGIGNCEHAKTKRHQASHNRDCSDTTSPDTNSGAGFVTGRIGRHGCTKQGKSRNASNQFPRTHLCSCIKQTTN